jgi:hypothetical protein
MKKLKFALSHAATLLLGAGLGVYFLPIVIAAHSPVPAEEIALQAGAAKFHGQFRRNLEDSDPLHWGEGTVSISEHAISLAGKLSPGPDYKLYLSPEFVETEADFDRVRPGMTRVGDVRTFNDFLVPLPSTVDPSKYNTVVVWCETFHKFISSAQYR